MGKPTRTHVRSIDVASLAGVSRSAVSRTFTPGAYVSAATREKVVKAADALGYHPNIHARSLITRRTGIVAVVAADLENPFYAVMLQNIAIGLQERGLASLLLLGDETSSDTQISQLLSYQVEAIITASAVLSSRLTDRISRTGLPVVAVNRYFPHDWITSITCDNEAAAAMMADHLVDVGCERIAFIAGKPDASSSRDREAGFLRQLGLRGARLSGREVGHYSHQGGAEATRRLLASKHRPDAIFCANDMMAFAAMDVARTEFGLRVPENVRIAGFDNSDQAAWPAHALTTFDQSLDEMIRVAIDDLADRLRRPDAKARHVKVQGSLKIRASTFSPAVPNSVDGR